MGGAFYQSDLKVVGLSLCLFYILLLWGMIFKILSFVNANLREAFPSTKTWLSASNRLSEIGGPRGSRTETREVTPFGCDIHDGVGRGGGWMGSLGCEAKMDPAKKRQGIKKKKRRRRAGVLTVKLEKKINFIQITLWSIYSLIILSYWGNLKSPQLGIQFFWIKKKKQSEFV